VQPPLHRLPQLYPTSDRMSREVSRKGSDLGSPTEVFLAPYGTHRTPCYTVLARGMRMLRMVLPLTQKVKHWASRMPSSGVHPPLDDLQARPITRSVFQLSFTIPLWNGRESAGIRRSSDRLFLAYTLPVSHSDGLWRWYEVCSANWTMPAQLNSNSVYDTGSDLEPELTTDGRGSWLAVWESPDDRCS